MKNVQEMYDKQLPPPADHRFASRSGYKFVSDAYTPTVHTQPEATVQQDQPDGSAKSSDQNGATDLNDKDDASMLTRQIPIIKVIGDLKEVSALNLNLGKIPTYKSDGLNEQRPKIINKDVFNVLKRELNELKKNFDLVKEVKSKRSFDEELERKELKEDDGQSTLERNLAILKEANLDQGPRKLEYRPSLPKVGLKERKSDTHVGSEKGSLGKISDFKVRF